MDASAYGIGVVHLQVQDGQEWVTAYGSRKLAKEERHYCATHRELLAVVYFIKNNGITCMDESLPSDLTMML